MSNKKITPQILGMYFGQEVEYGDMHCKIISISIGGVITVRSNGHWQDVESALCKPILRPLSDMTDDEAIEWFHFFYPDTEVKPTVNRMPPEFIQVHRELPHHVFQSASIPFDGLQSYSPESFLWLLSKGFDLFGLIESGLAIKQTHDTP